MDKFLEVKQFIDNANIKNLELLKKIIDKQIEMINLTEDIKKILKN